MGLTVFLQDCMLPNGVLQLVDLPLLEHPAAVVGTGSGVAEEDGRERGGWMG